MRYKSRLKRLVAAVSRGHFEILTVALELDPSAVKLAAVESKDSAAAKSSTIVGVEAIPFSRISEAVPRVEAFIAESLRKISSEDTGPRSPKETRLVVVLPRQSAIVRRLQLPSTDARELKAMARLQALTKLPFQEDEIVSDAVVLETDSAAGISTVLLVIVRKDAVVPYLDFFKELGRLPRGFVLSTSGAAEFIRRRKEPATNSYVHLGLSAGWMNIDLFLGGKLQSTRSVPFGQKELPIARVVSECRLTLASFATPGGAATVQRVFVSGAGLDAQGGLGEAIKEALAAPVEFLSGGSQDWPVVDPALIGAAYADAECALMLLPEELRERQSREEARRGIVAAASWLGIWLAVVGAIAGARLLRAEWRLFSLNSQLDRLEPDARKTSGMLEQAALLRAQTDVGAAPLDILRELWRAAPSGVTLRTVSCAPDGGLLIQGSAPRLAVVMEFVNGLQHSPLLARAELHGSSLRTVRNVDTVDFQIQGEIIGASESNSAVSKRSRS